VDLVKAVRTSCFAEVSAGAAAAPPLQQDSLSRLRSRLSTVMTALDASHRPQTWTSEDGIPSNRSVGANYARKFEAGLRWILHQQQLADATAAAVVSPAVAAAASPAIVVNDYNNPPDNIHVMMLNLPPGVLGERLASWRESEAGRQFRQGTAAAELFARLNPRDREAAQTAHAAMVHEVLAMVQGLNQQQQPE